MKEREKDREGKEEEISELTNFNFFLKTRTRILQRGLLENQRVVLLLHPQLSLLFSVPSFILYLH